jgi:hypothetical protein
MLLAATKLLHALSEKRKSLTCQRESGSSLQSIIGATLIFLFNFKLLSLVPQATYQRILALLVGVIAE